MLSGRAFAFTLARAPGRGFFPAEARRAAPAGEVLACCERFRVQHASPVGIAAGGLAEGTRALSPRWALVELDVLAARALGLTLEDLQTIYRIQFPVLRQSEADTWYDQNGRIVFTCSKGLPGVGLARAEWNEVKDLASGTVSRTVTDTTLPTGPVERALTYHAPFTRSDRETDYATVWGKLEAVASGQWAVGSSQWAVGSGQWVGTGSGQLRYRKDPCGGRCFSGRRSCCIHGHEYIRGHKYSR